MSDSTINILFAETRAYVSQKQTNRIVDMVSSEVRHKILRIKNAKRRNACIAGILLLKESLQGYGISEKRLGGLKTAEYGKPYFEDLIDFNISHSNNISICCTTMGGSVGIDIEKRNPIDIDVYFDYLPGNMLGGIRKSKNKLMQFYNCWTKFESVAKADGRGFAIPLDTFKILPDKAVTADGQWLLTNIGIQRDYCCSLAHERPVKVLNIQKVEL